MLTKDAWHNGIFFESERFCPLLHSGECSATPARSAVSTAHAGLRLELTHQGLRCAEISS